MKAVFIVVLFFILNSIFSQTFINRYTLGFPATEFNSIEKGCNDSIWVSGFVCENVSPYVAKTCLINLNSSGTFVRSVIVPFDTVTNVFPYYNTLNSIKNGCFASVGYSQSVTDMIIKLCLIKYNIFNNIEFIKEYEDTGTNAYFGYNVVQLNDKSFIIGGGLQLTNYQVYSFLVKTDSLGNFMWRKLYPGTLVSSLLYLSDNTILAGSLKTNYYLVPPGSPSWGKTYIFKADTAGNILWEYTDTNDKTTSAFGLQYTDDGNLLYGGAYTYFPVPNESGVDKPCITLIDTLGTKIWSRVYGGQPSFCSGIKEIKRFSDGNYLAVGINYDSTTLYWGWSGYLLKFDAQGNIIWDRNYRVINAIEDENYLWDTEIFEGDTIVAVGSSAVMQPQPNSYPVRGWIVKIAPDGCIIPGCQFAGIDEEKSPFVNGIAVFPNPAKEAIYFMTKTEGKFSVHDITGKTIQTPFAVRNDIQYILPLSTYSKGVYVITFATKKGAIQSFKFVKE